MICIFKIINHLALFRKCTVTENMLLKKDGSSRQDAKDAANSLEFSYGTDLPESQLSKIF